MRCHTGLFLTQVFRCALPNDAHSPAVRHEVHAAMHASAHALVLLRRQCVCGTLELDAPCDAAYQCVTNHEQAHTIFSNIQSSAVIETVRILTKLDDHAVVNARAVSPA